MVHYRDKYRTHSYCKKCGKWVPEPTYVLKDLAVEILPNPDTDRHPEVKVDSVYYDTKGWKHTILTRLYLFQAKWVKPIRCPTCGKQCKGKTHAKTDTRSTKDRERIELQNMVTSITEYEPSKRGRRKGITDK